MDINFLPEEDRAGKTDRKKKERQTPKEEMQWSSLRATGETKNKLAEKRGVKKYLPNFQAINFFKKKTNGASNSPDAKKIKESRKELLKFINQQKGENERGISLEKKESERIVPSPDKTREQHAQAEENGVKEKTEAPELKIKNKKKLFKLPNLKLPNFKVWLSSLFQPLKKREVKEKKIKADFLKEDDGEKMPKEKKIEKDEVILTTQNKEEIKTEKGADYGIEKETKPIEEAPSQNLETNLIKDQIIVFFDWKKGVISLSIYILLTILVLGAAYIFLSWQAGEKEKESQIFSQKFVDIDKEIKVVEQEVGDALIFKKKLGLVNSMLSQHIYWTNFFKFLEENTLADVYYLGFSGDNKGKYSLSVNAKDFYLIEAQVKKLLEDSRVIEASVSEGVVSATGNQKVGETAGINFELKLTVDPSIFNK
jgi:hypothetical protein